MESSAEPARRPLPILPILLFALIAGGVTLFFLLRGKGEPLTLPALEAARALWAEQGPRDYDLTVRVSGAMSGDHAIAVREGRVVSMRTGDVEAARTAWAYWTVPGMLDFLAEELSRAEIGRKGGGETLLRASFDAAYGYPRTFLRHHVGDRQSIAWEVTSFDPR
ncbi:MAG: DUF6174 domain-containing protein [Planctomycetaceae bacterium]